MKVFSGQRAFMDGPIRHPRSIVAGYHCRKLVESCPKMSVMGEMVWLCAGDLLSSLGELKQSRNFMWMIQWLSDHANTIRVYLKIASLCV